MLEFQIADENLVSGAPLIIALQGFSDAGNVVSQMQEYFKGSRPGEIIYQFPNDDFLDYRARRPTITFEVDHLTKYDPQSLTLSLAHDEVGAPFLLLSGYEPDFKWEAFVAAVEEIVTRFQVSTTTWVHAIPMPVPHTRPIGVTVSGNRKDLIESRSLWKPTTRLSASVGHVLEYALYKKGDVVSGFVLLIPHYLANTDFPEALKVALECTMDATGLLFSTESISIKQGEFLAQVDEQIAENSESVEMVKGLETRYDEYIRNLKDKSADTEEELNIPSGEELATDFEKFLAQQWGDEAGEGSQSDPE